MKTTVQVPINSDEPARKPSKPRLVVVCRECDRVACDASDAPPVLGKCPHCASRYFEVVEV